MCYQVKAAAKFSRVDGVVVADELGAQSADVIKPDEALRAVPPDCVEVARIGAAVA
jgi:hypothetical protein